MDVPARPERAGLAQRVLDIEQEVVFRDGAEIVVHVPAWHKNIKRTIWRRAAGVASLAACAGDSRSASHGGSFTSFWI